MANKVKQNFRVGAWNCNKGFVTKGKINEIEKQMMEHKLDICAVSEVEINNTKFHSDSIYQIKGYNFLLPKSWKKGRARSIVYYKKHLEIHMKVRKDLMSDDQPDIWIEMLSKEDENLIIGFYYREFTGIDGDKRLEKQKERLKVWTAAVARADGEEKALLLLGDFNVDKLKGNQVDESDTIPNILNKCCLERGLEQKIKFPTRSRVVDGRLESSCLDHIYTNRPQTIRKIKTIKISSSDHDLIKCARDTNDGYTPEKITVRTYKNFVDEAFSRELEEEVNWDEFYEEQDIHNCVEILTKNIKDVLDKHAPVVSFIPRVNTKAWITKGTIEVMAQREKAHEKCKKTKAKEDVDAFKKLRNKVVGLLRKDREEQKETLNKAKDAWRLVKEIEKKAEEGGPPKRLLIEGQLTSDPKKIAQHMNDYFMEKVEKNIEEIEKTAAKYCPIDHFKEHIEKPEETFSFESVDDKEVEEIIDKLKNSGGAGSDEIPNKALKAAKKAIKAPLTRIINMSLKEGVFPRSWKESVVVPLYKHKGDKREAKSQRPIYLLRKLSLCLESVMLKQLSEHWMRLKLLSDTQHGYVATRSCTTALVAMYDEWVREADQNKFVGIYLLDQSSAFELVDPYILEKKLEALNTGGKARQLILDYMLERPQRTKIGNHKSREAKKNLGVPAGSRIGPILYSIYTTDLPNTTSATSTIVSFADDSTNSTADKSAKKVKDNLEKDAEAISQYMRSNRLLIAQHKSQFVLASSKRKIRTEEEKNIKLKIGEHIIEQSEAAKILGIIMNSRLDYTNHLFGIPGDPEEVGLVKKLAKRIGLAYKIKHLPFKMRRMILSGIFLSKMMYGMELWGAATKGQIHQIELLQQKAAKLITKNPWRITAEENRKQCGWMRVEDSIKLRTLTLLHKARTHQTIPYLERCVGRGRRSIESKIPEYGDEQGQVVKRATISRFSSLWNDLPLTVRSAEIKTFKREARAHIENRLA